jgi:hypothetical protein
MRGTIPMSAGIFVTDYLRPAALKQALQSLIASGSVCIRSGRHWRR